MRSKTGRGACIATFVCQYLCVFARFRTGQTCRCSYLLLQRLRDSLPHHSVRRLQLQQSVEKVIGRHCQELDFCVGVQPIMHWALVGQHLVYEVMVALEM